MRVLICIPAYNEENNISKTIQDIENYAPKTDYIVINDCSTDHTRKVLRENDANYLDLPINLGIGGGVQTGYRYAMEHGYDIAIQFDGDGQHDARYLKDLIAPIESGRADVVIGSRFIKKEGFQSTGLRRLGINFLSGLIHILCGVKVRDVTSGMRAVNRRMIEQQTMPRITLSRRRFWLQVLQERRSRKCLSRCGNARAESAPSTRFVLCTI